MLKRLLWLALVISLSDITVAIFAQEVAVAVSMYRLHTQ